MIQALPTRSEYISALNNLGTFIIPKELSAYEAVRTKQGGPKIYSGGFVVTCQIEHRDTKVRKALRLFDQLPQDLEKRYEAISEFITHNQAREIFVRVVYLREGIVVNGKRYPICYMDWVEGVTLESYIRKHINTPERIQALPDAFAALIDSLSKSGAAHGDLSGENIMVTGDAKLVLVDYDGMYVPKLHGFAPCVAGQPNYQHPQRFQSAYRAYFGAYQDHFSAIALYLTLKALAVLPALYAKYNDDGRILLKKDDYLSPDTSPLLKEMQAHSELAPLVLHFRDVCKNDLKNCPPLKEFLKGNTHAHAVTLGGTVTDSDVIFTPEGNPVFSAISVDQTKLMRMQGNTGTLVGRIHQVTVQKDAIMCQFTSGASPASALYLIGDAMKALKKKGKGAPQQTYFNQYVKATGVVQAAQIEGFLVPSIELDDLNALTILSGGQEEADAIIAGKGYTPVTERPAADPTWARKPGTFSQPPPIKLPDTVDELFAGQPQRTSSLPPAQSAPAPSETNTAKTEAPKPPAPRGWGFDDE